MNNFTFLSTGITQTNDWHSVGDKNRKGRLTEF